MICRLATLTSREQAAEDPRGELERLRDGCARALRRRICISPRFQVFFRPEEGERRSEPLNRLTTIIASLAEPDHHAFGVRRWPVRRH